MRFSDIQTAWFLANHSVWRGNRAVLFLTPLIISLAVVNLLFFSGLFAGLYQMVDRQIIDSMLGNILVEPTQDHPYIVDSDGKIQLINSVPDVMASAPHYKSGALFSYDKDKDGRNIERGQYLVYSVEPNREKLVTSISSHMVAGRYLTDDDRDSIILGVEAAGGPLSIYPRNSLGGVNVGNTVDTTYSNGVTRRYTVVGIYKTGIDFADAMTYVTHKEMEGVLGVRDSSHEILIKTKPGSAEAAVVKELRKRGMTQEKITPYYDFVNYTGEMKRSFDFLKVITSMVSLIVVTITIFIVMFIHVTNKRKQLGILRAVGISEDTIVASYVFQALLYCLLGGSIGVAFMLGVLVPFFQIHPLNSGFGLISLVVGPADIALGIGIILATNLIAGYIPARLAIRKNIIDSIWGM